MWVDQGLQGAATAARPPSPAPSGSAARAPDPPAPPAARPRGGAVNLHTLWARWFVLGVDPTRSGSPVRTGAGASARSACPHCTNLDTLAPHCPGDRCGWARCTCGAVIYGRRRHRHPRHGSGADTCHDPAAAA